MGKRTESCFKVRYFVIAAVAAAATVLLLPTTKIDSVDNSASLKEITLLKARLAETEASLNSANSKILTAEAAAQKVSTPLPPPLLVQGVPKEPAVATLPAAAAIATTGGVDKGVEAMLSKTPHASTSFFKPVPDAGTYLVQKRSEIKGACDSWLFPGGKTHFDVAELTTPWKATYQICHVHEGWQTYKKFSDPAPQPCKDWYKRHPADDGAGAHCWEDDDSWKTKSSVASAPDFARAMYEANYPESTNNLGNALSCNDPVEAAKNAGPAGWDVMEAAKAPVRTEKQRTFFEACMVQPMCDAYKPKSGVLTWGDAGTKISQISQDTTVAEIFKYKRNGVYVDIGASDGIEYSNSYFLDKCHGWSGLMVDANWIRYMGLAGAGRSGDIVYGCVMDKDCTQKFTIAAGLSSVDAIEAVEEGGHDEHTARRDAEKMGTMMKSTVGCYNFSELLLRWMKHRNIEVIDYLTIDIEGAEWHALRALDLKKVPIRLIGIETDYTNDKFVPFLEAAGYKELKQYTVEGNDAFWFKEIGDTTAEQGKIQM